MKNPAKFIKDNPQEQSEKLCLQAVSQDGNPYVMLWVRIQTEKFCLKHIERDTRCLRGIADQTDKICKLAIKLSADSYRHIKSPTEEQTNLHKILWEV